MVCSNPEKMHPCLACLAKGYIDESLRQPVLWNRALVPLGKWIQVCRPHCKFMAFLTTG